MELPFILALVVAIVTFILTLVFGKKFGAWLGSIGAAVVIVPLLLIFLSGSTIERIMQYVVNQMPGIVIADAAGAIVGAIGGAIVSMMKAR